VSAPLAGHPGRRKVTVGGLSDLKAAGERVWFRNEREAKRVLDAFLSRCFESTKKETGLTVNLPFDNVVELVTIIARSLGITPIRDCDVTGTFDSIHRRVEVAIASMGRGATLKRMRAAVARIDAGDLRSHLIS
jgi:hypothetical protein